MVISYFRFHLTQLLRYWRQKNFSILYLIRACSYVEHIETGDCVSIFWFRSPKSCLSCRWTIIRRIRSCLDLVILLVLVPVILPVVLIWIKANMSEFFNFISHNKLLEKRLKIFLSIYFWIKQKNSSSIHC